MLCMINHLLNDGETLAVSDIAIHDEEQRELKSSVEKSRTERVYGNDDPNEEVHNTYALEETLIIVIKQKSRQTPQGVIEQWSHRVVCAFSVVSPSQLLGAKLGGEGLDPRTPALRVAPGSGSGSPTQPRLPSPPPPLLPPHCLPVFDLPFRVPNSSC